MRSAAGVAKVSFFVKIVSVGLQYCLKYQCVANEQKPLSFEKKMMFFLLIIFFFDYYVTKNAQILDWRKIVRTSVYLAARKKLF